jgi:hypothetical protein
LDNTALTRLRIGFVLLGALLLLPLFFVLRTAESRLEQQRRLRHEIVAARIFDEMERELGALLESERSRRSGSYDAASTHVGSWAPFVVGYFTGDRAGTHLAAAEQLTPARAQRVERALVALWHSSQAPELASAPAPAAAAAQHELEPTEKNSLERPLAPAAANQEDVLRQLNRGKRRGDMPSKQRADQYLQDPLMGL